MNHSKNEKQDETNNNAATSGHRLQGQRIIVTGSTAGIGRAMVSRFAEEGAAVLIHGRDREAALKLQSEIGNRVFVHTDDLSDPASASRIVDSAATQLGGIDALVNNAAWTGRSNIVTTTPEVMQYCLQVNLQSPLALIQAALPSLTESGGCVLNIGSVNAWCGEPELLAYSISKGGLATMTRNLGDALHREYGVRVNQFNLGWVLTDNEIALKRRDGLPDDWPKRLGAAYAPSGSIIPPEQIAGLAVTWVGHESRPISGSVIDLEQYPILGRNPPKSVE